MNFTPQTPQVVGIIEDFDLLIFIIVTAVGSVLSLLVAYFSSWFFSGFRGGGSRHTGSSIIGGFGKGQTAHRGSGIILSDEDREGMKPEYRKK